MKIIAASIIAQVQHVILFAITYIYRNGKERNWYLISRNKQPKCISGDIQRVDVTITVPVHKQANQLVIIKKFCISVSKYHFGFPAGLLNPGEDLEIVAGRELKEETGLVLKKIYRKSPAIFSSSGVTDETIAMVFAEASGLPSNKHNKASVEIEILLLEREEISKLLNRQDIVFGARAWLVMDTFVILSLRFMRQNFKGHPHFSNS